MNPNRTLTIIADLSAFLATHPVANPPIDFDPDGTWYSLETAQGNLYALNPNQGDLDRITPEGQISRVLDTSAVYGHIVPTALVPSWNFLHWQPRTFPSHAGFAVHLQSHAEWTEQGRLKRTDRDHWNGF